MNFVPSLSLNLSREWLSGTLGLNRVHGGCSKHDCAVTEATVVGNQGIFRFGEFAVARTTQSSVVSVLRAQHGDGFQFTYIHSPSLRICSEA